MNWKENTCCFTGHRPQKLPWCLRETDDRCLATKKWIADTLAELYDAGYRHFLCGMAIGCDTYFAEAVLALREQHGDVTLEAAVPCADQSKSWNAGQKEKYAALLERCDRKTVFRDTYSPGCMQERNRYMVDSSSMLVACFDGRPGGTMTTIAYARRAGLEIKMLDVSEV